MIVSCGEFLSFYSIYNNLISIPTVSLKKIIFCKPAMDN